MVLAAKSGEDTRVCTHSGMNSGGILKEHTHVSLFVQAVIVSELSIPRATHCCPVNFLRI